MKVINKRKITLIIVGIIIGVYSLTLILPVYFMVLNSLKSIVEFFDDPWQLPNKLYFDNYKYALNLQVDGVSVLRMFINSIILTSSATLIACSATTVTAYAVARFNFRGRNFLVAVGIGALLIPDLGSQSTIYRLFINLGIIDTWFILIKFASPFGLMFLIAYSLFRTISTTYVEAAKIDGASELRIFLQIMIPMAKGVIGMMVVVTAIGVWNDYYTPYMYLPTVKPLALGLQELAEEAATYSNYTELYAAMTLAVLPLIITFVFMRDIIINNAVSGGLKG